VRVDPITRAAHVARIILGVIFVVFGLNGFVLFITPPEHSVAGGKFIDLLVSSGFMYVEKLLEVVGGTLLLVNRYIVLGLVILGPLVVNILLFHLFLERHTLVIGVVPFVLWAWLLWVNRRHLRPLFVARV
jgi:putative oxidoreductase